MNIKKIFSFAASSIKFAIFIFFFNFNSNALENNIKSYSDDSGILSIMYHRFDENKYPSTNIKMEVFKEQIKIIKDLEYDFYDPGNLEQDFNKTKKEKKILLTIDDAFSSFYEVAWPYLKKEKIPFIIFVSTQPIGKKGYMTWEQIEEIEKEPFVYIGNHAHTHDYLIDLNHADIVNDIDTANKIFISKLGYNPIYFSYPFGEYSNFIKDFVSKNFLFAFGQHSGVIDNNKDKFELPRFPINEKYGDLKRFKFLINLYPLEYKSLLPDNKLLDNSKNPPNFEVEFFKNQKNINQINCFSDEDNKWEKSNIIIDKQKLKIKFRDKFKFRRGRINCSLNDDGKWRWFGVQFSVNLN